MDKENEVKNKLKAYKEELVNGAYETYKIVNLFAIEPKIIKILSEENIDTVLDIQNRGIYSLSLINGISETAVGKIKMSLGMLKNEITRSVNWDINPQVLTSREIEILEQIRPLVRTDNKYKFADNSSIVEEFQNNENLYIDKINELLPGFVNKKIYNISEETYKRVDSQNVELAGLKSELRDYQKFAVKYLLEQQRTLLGDQMGVGKTIEAIGAMAALNNAGHSRFAVICPAAVVTQWESEIKKHSTLMVYNHYEERDEAFRKWDINSGVLLTSYERSAWLVDYPNFCGSMLIVDEAHYIKNPDAKRSKRLGLFLSQFERASLLTGTAMENKVAEMIQLISYLNEDIASRLKNSTPDSFKQKIEGLYLRRRTIDVIEEMPELQNIDLKVSLQTPEEIGQYNEDVENDHGFQAMRRVSWIGDLSKSTKMSMLKSLVGEFSDRTDKAIIFSFYKDTLNNVSKELSKTIKVFGVINGSVKSKERKEIIDEFTRYDGPAVLAAQVIAGGVGLNIQAARTVIFLEPQIKPSMEDQAIARAWRMGQKQKVVSYRILAWNTVDEHMMDILNTKKQLFLKYADVSIAGDTSLEVEITQADILRIVEREKERIQKERESNTLYNNMTEEEQEGN